MTERDMEKMLCYLADRVERLEKERCKCNDGNDAKTLEETAVNLRPRIDETNAMDVPVLPPVYSQMRSPAFRSPRAIAFFITPSATRSL